MGWFDWLRSTPAPVIDHPLFGQVRASHRPRQGSWLWETLGLVATPRGDGGLTFDAGENGPNVSHERQWNTIIKQLDSLTEAAAPLIASDLSHWDEVPFDPASPWDELEWDGAHLGGDTSSQDEIALCYGCRHWPDALITVYFENGRPVLSQLDD